ncbi:D-alanyl-D-alanine carboxypeptidase family protein [Phycicoccus avicenniae]|uniref:D-alanyl-D-alanine carboxypeptidase family protein n=1 Tax=Phycicoccus avicenniae TaxID=2828860 RepID=UPI003D27F31B
MRQSVVGAVLRRSALVVACATLGAGLVAPAASAVVGTADPLPLPSPTPTSSPRPTPSPSTSPSPTPSPSPSPSATPRPPTAGGGHEEPVEPPPVSAAALAAQVAEAQRVAALIEGSTSAVAAEMRRMDELSDRSNAVLEELAAATDAQTAAVQEASAARADLARLESRLATARALVKDWVFDVYSGGGGNSDITGMFDAMQADDERVGDPLGDLSYITDQRTRALQEVRVLTAEQVRLTATAEQAEREAVAARTKISTAKAKLDGAMAAQRAKVRSLRTLQMAEVDKAGPIAGALVGARTPEARAAAERLRTALSLAVVETAHVGKPCSDDSGLHPNGMFPASALCPVWGAPGERLAPRPAAAFDAMSKAYAAQTGTPLCITDSYRSYSEQVAVKGTRGRFAATPGTSRHGLGRALDLCGGVDDFGSAAHRWMRQNAPLYGWFHPAWAEAGGSLPEPWHWEFAG